MERLERPHERLAPAWPRPVVERLAEADPADERDAERCREREPAPDPPTPAGPPGAAHRTHGV